MPSAAQRLPALYRGAADVQPLSPWSRARVFTYGPVVGSFYYCLQPPCRRATHGKHRSKEVTPSTRFDNNLMYQDRYWHDQNFKAVERLHLAAETADRSLISLSLNWLFHHTMTDCVILGASKMEQLEQNLSALDEGPLPTDSLKVIDEVWFELRGSTPLYNR